MKGKGVIENEGEERALRETRLVRGFSRPPALDVPGSRSDPSPPALGAPSSYLASPLGEG